MIAGLWRRIETAGEGYPPLYPAVTLAGAVAFTLGALVQRLPLAPPWWAVIATMISALSLVFDLWLMSKIPCILLAAAATAVFLLDPVAYDVAPLMLALTTAIAAAMETLRWGLFAAALSVGVIVVGSQSGHLDSPAVYVLAVLCGWLVGYMIMYQKLLSENEVRRQSERADRAAGDERRRIAREIHDVIAHSLSITVLNVTGARRALQEGATDEAIEALEDAERLGRQAMTEIRYIVKVLGAEAASTAPTPGADDIGRLVDEYRRAGVEVTLDMSGDLPSVPHRSARRCIGSRRSHWPTSSSTPGSRRRPSPCRPTRRSCCASPTRTPTPSAGPRPMDRGSTG
ncbi:sensor histidine kinase [Gordonia sp. OPL2]|uniref:sensor histidine kinase n=1 Tax=Gordonia sp. OPL2 TaxID=2486274 RepID=UPI0021CC8B2F|nr:histidine kinase dimerization/phosphoacceptor domain-containing protein [Gordonia sp. OPL2]